MLSQRTIITAILLLLVNQLIAQTTIKGTVTDQNGTSIPGANIYIENTFDGTNSKPDGSFEFKTTETGILQLIASFIGFEPFKKAIEIKGDVLTIEITLKESINKLDGVTITAGAYDASDERATVLKPLDIVTTASAAGDIMGALNTLPGTTTVGESGRLFVRGGEGYETKVFIDGLEVRNAFNSTVPNVPTRGRFSPFLFKGTNFSTGGYSAEYGQALSSVLILNSFDIADEDKTEISVMSVGADISHTELFNENKTSVSGKLQYTDLRPYQEVISQNFDWKTAPHSAIGEIVFRQKFNKDGLLKVYTNFDNSYMALRQPNVNKGGEKDTVGLDNKYRYINASYKDILHKKWSVRGGVTYTYNRDKFDLNQDNYTAIEDGLHIKLAFNWDASDKVSVNFGSEQYTKKFKQVYAGSEAESGSMNFHDDLSVGFMEVDYFASNKLVFRAGLRSTYSSLLREYYNAPRFAASYKVSEFGQFSFAHGQFYQQAQNNYSVVNNSLTPEMATHWVLNYQRIKANRIFRIEAFKKDYDDLVTYNTPNDFNPNNYANAGSGYAQGIDVFWRDGDTFKETDYWVSYSYTDAERMYLNYPEKGVPNYLAKHNFSFVIKHFVQPLRTQFGATYSYASERMFHNPNKPGFMNDSSPFYSDLSLNAAVLIKQNIILYMSSSNVLGRNNVFGYEFADQANGNGVYESQEIIQSAKRFVFFGLFITLTKDGAENQLDNL